MANEIEILEKALHTVASLDFNDVLSYERAMLEYSKIQYLPIFQYVYPAKSPVFRTRRNTKDGYFNSISEITYPKPEYIKKFGRLNKPEQSVFYCSENRPTSYMELVEGWAEEIGFGETLTITITEWILKRDLVLVMVVNPNPHERQNKYDQYHGSGFDNVMSRLNDVQKEVAYRFFEFLSSEFYNPGKKNKATYIKTSAFSNLVMIDCKCDGLIYPSVPFMGEGFNIVIKPEIIDKGEIVLNSAMRSQFRAEKMENGKHNFIEIEQQHTKNIDLASGKIEW